VHLLDWIEQPYGDGQMKVKERFAELIVCNGGRIAVNKVGHVEKADNPYGRIGISVNEGFELQFLAGILEGMMISLDQNLVVMEAFKMKIQEVIDKRKAEMEASGIPGGPSVIMASEADLKQALEQEKVKQEVLGKLRNDQESSKRIIL
jgi:hypothetical protein